MAMYTATLWEGQSLFLTLPRPGMTADSYTVHRYTSSAGQTAAAGSDYQSLDLMTDVPGGNVTLVTKVDGAAEGDETFQYVYNVQWTAYGMDGYGYGMGDYAQEWVWTITLHDAKNQTGTSSANTLNGTPGYDKLAGAAGNDTLSGAAGNDTLLGGANVDQLAGGKGNDRLTGNHGADEFVFAESGAANADTLTDFTHGTDKIVLDDAAFAKLVPTAAGGLKPATFHLGSAAADSNDYVIYDPSSGNLYYDPDGSGAHAQKLIATLTASPDNVAAADFRVT
jgi:Ca2+-binding RTX toxin-like protein